MLYSMQAPRIIKNENGCGVAAAVIFGLAFLLAGLVFWPIWILAVLCFILAAMVGKVTATCGACGNTVAETSVLCPTCGTTLHEKRVDFLRYFVIGCWIMLG